MTLLEGVEELADLARRVFDPMKSVSIALFAMPGGGKTMPGESSSPCPARGRGGLTSSLRGTEGL